MCDDAKYGDIRDELDEEELECMYCDATVKCDLQYWGLNWPDLLEGWFQIGEYHICPKCSFMIG